MKNIYPLWQCLADQAMTQPLMRPHDILDCEHRRTYRDADEYLHCFQCHALLAGPPEDDTYLAPSPTPPPWWMGLGAVGVLLVIGLGMATWPVWWVLLLGAAAGAVALGVLAGMLMDVGGGQ